MQVCNQVCLRRYSFVDDTSLLRWYFQRVVETLRYDGFPALLWRAIKVCLFRLGNPGMVNLCQKDLTQPMEEVKAKVELTVCQASQSDIDQLATLVSIRYGPTKNLEWYSKLGIRDTILQRFRWGHKCFVGKIGPEIVHYNWIFFRWGESIPGEGCFIHLKDDEALMDDSFTVERWRGRGIHTAVHNGMLLFLQQKGYRRAYTIVGINNKSSKKTHNRIGWEFSGTMLYFIPRGNKKVRIWRIKGILEPFIYERTPSSKGS